MNRCLFFTKTDWNEQPRIRHQLALLLKYQGYTVLFFEKPYNFFLRKIRKQTQQKGDSEFLRTSELLHHKLRLNSGLRSINAYWEKNRITEVIDNFSVSKNDIVINFNYDYFFLRHLFPKNKIITIINDDFWCRSLFGYEKPLKDALCLTCRQSDFVLAVSEPLVEELSEFCKPKLFLPWSDASYSKSNSTPARRSLLFWGYINNRLNYDYIARLADALRDTNSQISIDFIGPVEGRINKRFYDLIQKPNVTLSDPCDLDSIEFEKTLAAFIPYVKGNKADDVTTLPNKALPMLANGIPLLITGMPNFLEAPFVLRLGKTMGEDLKLIASLPEIFDSVQPSIKNFVNLNTAQKRYEQFASYLT